MADPSDNVDDEGDVAPSEEPGLPVPTRNIMLTIAYDGTSYRGWQVQPNGLSVQECVESAVLEMTGEQRRVYCAGRTDAGVHALGQAANFRTASRIPIGNVRRALQTGLPEDITIVSAIEVAESFHSTFSAVRKRYRYVIHDGDVCPPFLRNYVQRSPYHLNSDAMSQAAQHLLGTHDFRCFETKFPNKMTSVRTIMDASIQRIGGWQPWLADHQWLPMYGRPHGYVDRPFIVFEVMADGFLYNMVRAIVGTLTDIGRGKQPPEYMARVVASQDRTKAGMTAVPNGLYLVQVDYPPHLLTADSVST